MRGWTITERRLFARGVDFDQAVALLTKTLRNQQLVTAEGQAVLEVVQHYARTWRMLRAYDEDQLSSAPGQTSAPIASRCGEVGSFGPLPPDEALRHVVKPIHCF